MNPQDDGVAWPSGVTGAQCDGCLRFTVVRRFAVDDFDPDERWLCLPCWRVDDDEEFSW